MATRKEKKPSTAKSEPLPTHPLARCIPRGDRVVVQREVKGDSSRTPGGVLLPDTYDKGADNVARVWSVGPGLYDAEGQRQSIDLRKGQRVIITSYAGLAIKDPTMTSGKDDEFLLLREEDILAVLPD